MKTISIALAGYFAAPARKRAVCVSITRIYGSALTVYGTAWDEDLTIDGHLYSSRSGGALSDVDASSALNVDNAEINANFDAITTADLQAGLWSNARISVFVTNPDDLTMGVYYIVKDWDIGQITVDRKTWIGELRGHMQALQQSYGWLVSPTCPHTLGDAMCRKDLTAFTVTGTLDSVSANGLTFTDSARTEAGPSGGVAITAIPLGNPTVVHTASALGLTDGAAVNLTVVGPTQLSGPWQARNPTGTQFEINVDSTSYSAFVSGTVNPLSGESGYFTYGKMRLDSGDPGNVGLWREVKSYIVGALTLQKAFPFAVAGTESYTMVAGCDKLEETCRVKFENILNFLGFRPKGNDWLMQVGRSE